MLKKFLAGLTAIALSLGMVALTAGPASAHHNTINTAVSCNTGTGGTWKVTWTVTNSESDKPETITSSTDTALVPIGTVIAAGATATFVEYYNAKPASNKTLTLGAQWSNGVTNSNSGTLNKSSFSDSCDPNENQKVQICHANEGNGWTSNNVSVNSILNVPNGHRFHDDDIIPPFTYSGGSFAGLNWDAYGQWVWNNGCDNEVTPTAPTFTNAQCTGPGTYGQASYTIPATTGVTYWVSINDASYAVKAAGTYFVNVGTKVKVYAAELPGYELEGNDNNWKWDKTFSAPNCEVDVTPTKPTIVQAVCTGEDQVGQASYTIPSITGVKYQISSGGNSGPWTDIAAGVHYAADGSSVWIQAVALAGYDIDGTSKWKLEFDDITSSKCDVPAAPTFAAQICTGPGSTNTASYTIPSDSGIQYQVRIDGGSWQNVSAGTVDVTVFPRLIEVQSLPDGSIIVPGSTTYWSYNFTSAGDCLVNVEPVEPDWTDSVCQSTTTGSTQSTYEVFAVSHVTYEVSTDGGNTWAPVSVGVHNANPLDSVIIRAIPDAGYALENYTGPWSHTFADPGDCLDEAFPGDPKFVDSICEADTTGATQATYEIVAAAHVTYEISTDGVTYTTVGAEVGVHDVTPPTHIWIKAIADPGYEILVPFIWDHVFASPGDCLDDATATPATDVDQKCVVDQNGGGSFVSGYLVIPNSPNVEYFIDGSVTPATPGQVIKVPGTYTVTAAATAGYQLVGYTGPWVLEIKAAELCGDLIILPVVDPVVTFTQTTCSASGSYTLAVDPAEESAGVIWTVSGGLPNTLGTHSVTTAGTVTITATPAPGYGFTDDEDAFIEWSYDFTSIPDDCLPTLALTGAPVAVGLIGLWGVLSAVGVLLIVSRNRRAVTEER